MDVLSCTVGGQTVALHIRRTAKKNIIARPRDTGSLNVSIPPRLPLAAVSPLLHPPCPSKSCSADTGTV